MTYKRHHVAANLSFSAQIAAMQNHLFLLLTPWINCLYRQLFAKVCLTCANVSVQYIDCSYAYGHRYALRI